MADWLLLRLPADPADPVSWVVVDSHGQLLSAPAAAVGAELVAAAQGRRVALLVPGSDVLQLSANLPQGSDAKLQQLVPWALEDQLSEDVESLHFALGTRASKDAGTPVLVVAKALLDGWLERAQALQVKPQAVFADSDLVPELPGHVMAMLDGSHLTLRGEHQRPVVMPAEDPGLALEMLLGSATGLDQVHLSVQATPLGWQRHAAAFEQLRGRLGSMKVQLASGGPLALLAPGIVQPDRINLLQGAYRPQQESGATWKRWRLVAGLAAALLALHALGNAWQLRQLRSSERALDAAIEQAAAVALPGEPLGGDLRRRVEQRLGVVAGGGPEEGEFLHLLAALAAAHDNVPVTRIETLSFKPGNLDLRVTAPDAASLEQLSQALRAGGYAAEVTSGSAAEGRFQGSIVLKGPGS